MYEIVVDLQKNCPLTTETSMLFFFWISIVKSILIGCENFQDVQSRLKFFSIQCVFVNAHCRMLEDSFVRDCTAAKWLWSAEDRGRQSEWWSESFIRLVWVDRSRMDIKYLRVNILGILKNNLFVYIKCIPLRSYTFSYR